MKIAKIEIQKRLGEAWLQAFEIQQSLKDLLCEFEGTEESDIMKVLYDRTVAITELLHDITPHNMSEREASPPELITMDMQYRRKHKKFQEISDEQVEKIWEGMVDIPFDEEYGDLVISQDYYIWSKGTPRDEIWGWFDKHHSAGVYYLLYESEV
jgi:hypothetical protein